LRFFWGNFPNSNPNHKWLTRPDPSHKKLTRPGSKIFDPDPSLETAEGSTQAEGLRAFGRSQANMKQNEVVLYI